MAARSSLVATLVSALVLIVPAGAMAVSVGTSPSDAESTTGATTTGPVGGNDAGGQVVTLDVPADTSPTRATSKSAATSSTVAPSTSSVPRSSTYTRAPTRARAIRTAAARGGRVVAPRVARGGRVVATTGSRGGRGFLSIVPRSRSTAPGTPDAVAPLAPVSVLTPSHNRPSWLLPLIGLVVAGELLLVAVVAYRRLVERRIRARAARTTKAR